MGRPKGTKGRPKRRPSAWPKGQNLKTREACIAFIETYIGALWDTNVLDARLGGCINGAIRLLGDIQGWITKAPLQIIQAQIMPAPGMITEKEVQELLEALPLEHQLDVWKKFKERRGLRPNIPSGSQS